MKSILPFLKFELKTLTRKWRLISLLLFIFIALMFFQLGIKEYKHSLSQEPEFLQIEAEKMSQFVNYRQYGGYGFNILFMPAPHSAILNRTGIINESTAHIDTGSNLSIVQSLRGENLFKQRNPDFTGFSGFILFIGSFLALLYGYETHRGGDFIKFLSTLATRRRLFISAVVARIIIILFLLLILFAGAQCLGSIQGIYIPVDGNMLFLFLGLFLVLVFFFMAGTIFNGKSRITGIVSLFLCWCILLLFVPAAVDFYIAYSSDYITSLNKIEMKKLKLFMDIEKSIIKKTGTFALGEKPSELLKKLVKQYLENDLKKIEAVERNLFYQVQDSVKKYHTFSLVFPTTFYRATDEETGGLGYGNFLDYYDHSMDLKNRFIKYIYQKVYFSNFTTIEPFLKGKENIYYSKSKLPPHFGWGILLIAFYITAGFFISYRRYLKRLYIEPEREFNFNNIPPLKILKNSYETVFVITDEFKNRFFNLLSLRKTRKTVNNFKGHLFIDDRDVTELKKPENFFYLCPPRDLQLDIKVKDLLLFFCGIACAPGHVKHTLLGRENIDPYMNHNFNTLKYNQKNEVFLHLLSIKKADVYIVDDIGKNMPIDFNSRLSGVMDKLANGGAHVVYLTTECQPGSIIDIDKHPGYQHVTYWKQSIESIQFETMNIK